MKIGIIGAGYAGMSAAYDLIRAGTSHAFSKPPGSRADWPPASKSRTGIGRWKISTTIGLPPTHICLV